jgi:hypothetical protein
MIELFCSTYKKRENKQDKGYKIYCMKDIMTVVDFKSSISATKARYDMKIKNKGQAFCRKKQQHILKQEMMDLVVILSAT